MITIKALSVAIAEKKILEEISFDICPGKISVVLGKNGAGKSTLLKTIASGRFLHSGSIQWDHQDFAKLSKKSLAIRRAVLSQAVLLGFSLSVRSLVEMGTYVAEEMLTTTKIKALVESALKEVEMLAFIDRDFRTLSGGEQKRVLLAKCIVQMNCCCRSNINKYLFLDEPTASLDIEQQYKFIALVKRIVKRQKIGVLAVLHDLNLAAQFADEILILRNRALTEKGRPIDVLTPEKIKNNFDVASLVQRHPVLDCPHIITLPQENAILSHSIIK